MTNKNDNRHKHLLSMADVFFEDLMAAADDEIISEFLETGNDPKTNKQHMCLLFETALTQSKKSRLASAKKRISEPKNHRSSKSSMSINEARERIKAALSTQSLEIITLAARHQNENEMSDDETFDMIDDLIELGLIDSSNQDENNS
tara:strand:- start:987 stop:1427 length:441 start_codon:yes stop_codon:yes gene_type:complete